MYRVAACWEGQKPVSYTHLDVYKRQIQRFATPRRLAVLIERLPIQQADRQLERRGPALSAAFGPDGRPTKAAEGFARSCGVGIADLQRVETDKGAWLIHVSTEAGAPTANLIPGIVEAALAGLPIPKRMRWGDRDAVSYTHLEVYKRQQ